MVSAGISIGSEMSVGASNVTIENVHVWKSRELFGSKQPLEEEDMLNTTYRNLTFENVPVGIIINAQYNEHPDEGFDPMTVPRLEYITYRLKMFEFQFEYTGVEIFPYGM